MSTIFDLGMHRGLDTRFYLDKGFRVVALEANPALVAEARGAFAPEIADGRLAIEDRALWSDEAGTIAFWVNSEKDDWSSAIRGWAEKGGHAAHCVEVATVTLGRLFDRHGVPYYAKCDIEGADEVFVRQLHDDPRRPAFVSVEAASADLFAYLRAAGYDRFQIVNQAFLPFAAIPDPAREGVRVEARFNGHMSGLFGRELEPARWKGFRDALDDFLAFERLRHRDPLLAHGWIDVHATTHAALADG
ncbi:MAG: FkbM family methyltransferase [Paracoccaceae bacterium]